MPDYYSKPDPAEFDPQGMAWWSLPMALAWISWRSIESVREHCPEYRQDCRVWIPPSSNVPINNGTEFERVDGYELGTLPKSTVPRLSLTSDDGLPKKMTVSQAG
jgi:hypothetical protein